MPLSARTRRTSAAAKLGTLRGIGIIRAEVFEDDHGLAGAVVGDGDAGAGGGFGDEVFVGAGLSEAEHDGGFGGVGAEGAVALDQDAAIGGGVFHGDGLAGVDGEFLGAEIFVAVGDPFFGVAGVAVRAGNRGAVIGFLVMGVDIFFPVHEGDDVVEVALLLGGAIFNQKIVRVDFGADDVFVDGVDVGIPLGFVGEDRAGGVYDAGGGVPAGAKLDAVSAGELGDAVVAFFVLGETFFDHFLGDVGVEAEIGDGEFAEVVVELGGEVIRFGFAEAAYAGGGFEGEMQVVEERGAEVEEFGVHGPGAEFLFQFVADDLIAEFFDGVAKREFLRDVFGRRHDVGHAFILGGKGTVHGGDDGAEPAFFDRAAIGAVGVVVVRVEAEALAGGGEAAGDEDGEELEDAVMLFESFVDSG